MKFLQCATFARCIPRKVDRWCLLKIVLKFCKIMDEILTKYENKIIYQLNKYILKKSWVYK